MLNTTEQVLVIILAAFLAIFLILAIITLIWILKVIKQLKRVADKAESLAEKAENLTKFFEKTAPTIALGKVISNVTKVFNSHKNSSTKGEEE